MTEPRTNPFISKSSGNADQKSRSKAEMASNKANEETVKNENEQANWPLGVRGQPMIKAEMSASELVPTGQYANVMIGPCRLHFLIDPDRELQDGETYFSPSQRARIAQALNEAADIVEGDVVAVQRNIVMESMQEQLGS
jgi:hypothetical protein